MTENKDATESLKEKIRAQSKASRIMLSDREMEFKEVISEMKRQGGDSDKKYRKEQEE